MSDEPSDLEPPALEPLEALREAVQAFVNTQVDQPTLVDNALVVWEEVSFGVQDGLTQRRMRYCVPTENFTLSGTLGLLEGAGTYVRRDILGQEREEDQ